MPRCRSEGFRIPAEGPAVALEGALCSAGNAGGKSEVFGMPGRLSCMQRIASRKACKAELTQMRHENTWLRQQLAEADG